MNIVDKMNALKPCKKMLDEIGSSSNVTPLKRTKKRR